MPYGNLVFVLRAATEALPINNGSITVTDEGGRVVFYEFLTSADSGVSKTATLEAPPKALSLDDSPNATIPYSLYNVRIRAEGWYRIEINGVQMFESITSTLPIELIPLPLGISSPEDAEVIIINLPEHFLRTPNPKTPESPDTYAIAEEAVPAVIIGESVYIPETITVHLGAPDSNSQNVTVSFTDYIKNVASSEIYPTWPSESLRANIIAQISLSLNRIYTEWYRSMGYDFDITSSTAYDQSFVFGRNIYDEISVIVDDIFNSYLVRPNRVEPLFASYCDGSSTTCAGLSQWGTVALAESGQSSEDILRFYYGDVDIAITDDIRTPEESYPGTPLTLGAEGEDVRIVQEQLNRIAINFPQIPLIEVNGIFNSQTESSVRIFQRLFVLSVNGIVDKATWYRISQIYASVKRLAELTSEGQRAAYNQQLYPGFELKTSSRGSEVQEIQFYLQRISRFNPVVKSPKLDGIFGSDTANAVISFQRAYGLTPNGIIDEASWNRLVEVYNGTLENPDEPQNEITPIPYPNTVLSVGSRGEYVRYIQQLLNVVNNVFLTIPELDEDGVFGNGTERAVREFSNLFGLSSGGSADGEFWSKLNEIYLTVNKNCIFSTSESAGAKDYPNYIIGIGSMGDNVAYIQARINVISSSIPYIQALATDGNYGSRTAESVRRLQIVFGLEGTGSVNKNTWLLINYVYASVVNGCLPSQKQASASALADIPKMNEIKVSELKEILRRNGINVGSGPIFGIKSRKALAEWQIKHSLEPTGLPDRETRAELMKNSVDFL